MESGWDAKKGLGGREAKVEEGEREDAHDERKKIMR
jgi:hypothetical protein